MPQGNLRRRLHRNPVPSPYICSGGLCIDPCVGVLCGTGKTCVNGACVTTCDCPAAAAARCRVRPRPASAWTTAVRTSPAAPASLQGRRLRCHLHRRAVCPSGQRCTAGACIDDTGTGPRAIPMAASVATTSAAGAQHRRLHLPARGRQQREQRHGDLPPACCCSAPRCGVRAAAPRLIAPAQFQAR